MTGNSAATTQRRLAQGCRIYHHKPSDYGEHDNTIFEHLDQLRREFGFLNCGWPQLHALGNEVLPLALESERSLPLIEFAVERLRAPQIIAPGITTLERLVWSVQRLAQRRVEHLLIQPLSCEQRARLDDLLQVDPELGTRIRLSWLREAPEIASGKSLRKVLDRLGYVRSLELPIPDRRLHPNRLRQLAARGAQYAAQPLARFGATNSGDPAPHRMCEPPSSRQVNRIRCWSADKKR